MKRTSGMIWITALTLAAVSTVGAPLLARASGDETQQAREEIDAMARATMRELISTVDGAEALAKTAKGHAVFRATKGGFVVTGAGGTGVAVNDATGQRTYMRMGAGGIGLGAGLQNYRVVFLFQTNEALTSFIQKGWDASTSAQAAAGKAGVNATSSFVDGVAVYQLTDKGLMAQADLAGTHFWKNDKLNPSTTPE